MRNVLALTALTALALTGAASAAEPPVKGRTPPAAEPAPAKDHAIVSPRDPASGLPTGQRMHKPFRIAAKDGKQFYEVTVDAAGVAQIRLAAGADGPAAGPAPDGKLLLKGGVEVTVKGGVVIDGAERIGIAPLPSP
jgi:hypothetical protein